MIAVALTMLCLRSAAANLARQISARTANTARRFPATFRFDQPDGRVSLLLDLRTKRIAVSKWGGHLAIHSGNELLAIEVVRNNAAILRTNPHHEPQEAPAHRALSDCFEILLGKIRRSKSDAEPIRRLTLKLLMSVPSCPVYEIVFLEQQDGMTIDDQSVTLAAIELHEWYRRLWAISRCG